MATGSDLPKLFATSGPTDDETGPPESIVPESAAHREPVTGRESPSNRESPNDRLQSQGAESQPVPQGESDCVERANAERANAERANAEWACCGLNGGDRRFLTVVAAIALVLMAVHWVRITQWSPVPVAVDRPAGERYRFVLDANRATWVEWMQLDGIGETLARRIVADREQNGPFPDVDALDRVPGIGPKTLERIRADVIVGDVTVLEMTEPRPQPSATSGATD